MNENLIERNRAVMRRFETCINTNDIDLAKELISEKAAFKTPVSPIPLMGAEGYMEAAGSDMVTTVNYHSSGRL